MITIDLDSPIPIEDQIRRGIQHAVARGVVKPGDALPSVRQLAGDLGIHWNTVARAYRRLRDDGLLTVGRGRAVTVRSAVVPPARTGDEWENVEALLDSAITQAKLRGLTYDELCKAVGRRLESWRGAWEGAS